MNKTELYRGDAICEAFFTQNLTERDAELMAAVNQEFTRQETQIELIASENIVSISVLPPR